MHNVHYSHGLIIILIFMVSFFTLLLRGPAAVSMVCALGLLSYLLLLITECALKAFDLKPGGFLMPLPTRAWALFIAGFLIASDVLVFANLYLSSEQVINNLNSNSELIIPMTSRLDAVYFSLVTLTTLGFGDFAPNGSLAPSYVILQLLSGTLLLLFLFPILASRISNWE